MSHTVSICDRHKAVLPICIPVASVRLGLPSHTHASILKPEIERSTESTDSGFLDEILTIMHGKTILLHVLCHRSRLHVLGRIHACINYGET